MKQWRERLSELGYVWVDAEDIPLVISAFERVGKPTELTPRSKNEADPWSLSGTYGLGAFPWHTDGAISVHPPHLILLRVIRMSEPSSTDLLDPSPQILTALQSTVLRATDRAGRHRYLPAAMPTNGGRWRVRWDPRTCMPKTGMTIAEMEQQEATTRVEWRTNRFLVIDNLRLLHRRPAVDSHAERSLERTYIWEHDVGL
jgi:Taurine catabolism dioxygenase TauD, TfdA family